MADESVRRNGDTDEDSDAANDVSAEESDDTADSTAEDSAAPNTPEEPPTDESPPDAATLDGSQAPTDSEAGQGDEDKALLSEQVAADDARRGEGRIARLASCWPLRGRFWRFIAGVWALSATALLVLAVVAVAIEVFDDDYDDGWFAYAGNTELALVPGETVFHNGYSEYPDSLHGDGYPDDGYRDKAHIGRRADCDGQKRECRDARQHHAGPGRGWMPPRSGFSGRIAPGLSGRLGPATPDVTEWKFGGPLSGLPGPLELIPALGDAEFLDLMESCEQLRSQLDDWDSGTRDGSPPQLGVRELLLAVVCPADDMLPLLFGDDDHAIEDSDRRDSNEHGGDDSGVGGDGSGGPDNGDHLDSDDSSAG